jgi:putative membrane protein
MLDLHLAIVHHLLAFLLFGVIVAELALIRAGLGAHDVRQAGKIDQWYGILAGLLIGAGAMRVAFAAKGWAYYSANLFFWAKMGAFAVVGLLSILPTVKIIGWRQALKADPATLPDINEIVQIRKFLWAELLVFALIPAFAAAMARGYGMMG